MLRLLALMSVLIFVSSFALAQNQAPPCDPTPTHQAVRIAGVDDKLPFVAGDTHFYQTLENGWVFALVPAELGWSIRLYEGEPVGAALDLTSATPPLRGAPNPRDIFGWHFRNLDNTGPNTGDVNAPQETRIFVIAPTISSAEEQKGNGEGVSAGPSANGVGWFKIVDYGLANPIPNTKARMNYLQFDACLSWPRSDVDREQELDRASLDFTEEDREIFGKCGLDLNRYGLAAPFAPRQLAGDFDGDDAEDLITRIRRKSDDALGVAVCRAGTWIKIFGYTDFQDLRSRFVDQMEAWTVLTDGGETPRQLSGFDLPDADGDLIFLDRIEKEGVLLYRLDGGWRAKRIYGRTE